MRPARLGQTTFGRHEALALYETVFIVRPDVSAQHVDGMAGNFAAIVGEGGGTVSKTENWGLRSLAYRIKKNRKGHYVLMNIDAPASAIGEMERNMRIDEDIVRYLTVRVDALEDGPSIVMRAKAARDDRGRRDRRRGDGPPPASSKPAAGAGAEAKPQVATKGPSEAPDPAAPEEPKPAAEAEVATKGPSEVPDPAAPEAPKPAAEAEPSTSGDET